MAFVTLEDFAGQTEVLVFADACEAAGSDLALDQVVAGEGRVSTRENEEPKIVAGCVMTFERARRDLVGALEIELDAGAAAELVEALDRTLARHPGPGQVIFKVFRATGDSVRVLAKGRQVELSREVLREPLVDLDDRPLEVEPGSVRGWGHVASSSAALRRVLAAGNSHNPAVRT